MTCVYGFGAGLKTSWTFAEAGKSTKTFVGLVLSPTAGDFSTWSSLITGTFLMHCNKWIAASFPIFPILI